MSTVQPGHRGGESVGGAVSDEACGRETTSARGNLPFGAGAEAAESVTNAKSDRARMVW